MSSTFWTNTIWFILLGITTIIELIIVFYKAENRKSVLALYCTVCGITYNFEITIFAIFHSYNYYPMVILNYPFDDGIVGNLFSQFSVSATALLIAVLDLKFYWYLIFAGIYGIIEELFLHLGIYKHNWYQTWMTVAGFLLLSWITKKMYKSLKKLSNFWRYIYILFGLFTLHVNTMWSFRQLGIHTFSTSLFSDYGRSSGILSGSYYLLLSNIIMVMCFKKVKWWWQAIVISALYISHYIAAKLNLMYYKEGWFFTFTTIAIFSMYLYIYILDKLYGSNRKTDVKY